MLRKLQQALELFSFMRRYPEAQIVGGPTVLSWLGKRHSSALPGYFSQCGQDAYLATQFFHVLSSLDFPKLFVDVGCNHPVKHNNSNYFETILGFRVLAIDALPTHQEAWIELRPNAKFEVLAVGNEDGFVEFQQVEPDDRSADMFSSVTGASTKAPTLQRRLRRVPIARLSTILNRHGLSEVGVLSIDIEGYEMQALQGIDFDACRIEMIILENNSERILGDDHIRDFLISKGYRYVARIWGMDDFFVHRRLAKR